MSDTSEALAERLFLEASELEGDSREAFLSEHCAGQEPLLARVRELLAYEARLPTGFLQGSMLPQSAYLEPGTLFAGFRILRRLGEGGMGTVYVALQSMPKREVALKVVRPGRMSESALRRFRHEVEVLGNLQHPGIAQIFEAGTASDGSDGGTTEQPYFAMELVKGQPLLAFVRENELDDRQRIELLARLCDAVQHAHQRAVIHRDLKPENVLVTLEESSSSGPPTRASAPSTGRPVILDFGIARAIGPEGVVASGETRAGDLVGTLAYMSPERLGSGGAIVDVRSDVYALGVLLYQLLAGRLPFELADKDLAGAIRELREVEPVPLGDIHPRFKGDVSTLVQKALAKDMERRYPSALELAADLRRYLGGEPIRARSDSTLYVMRRQLRRHRLALSVGAAITVLVAAFGVSSAVQAKENERLAVKEAQASARSAADFRQALEAIATLVEVGHRRLRDIPQAEGARRELLLAARDFHERLIRDHDRDPVLYEGLMETKLSVVRILNNLGEHAECVRDAESLRDELVAAPATAERDGLLRETLRLLGISLDELGRQESAVTAFEESKAVAESTADGELDWQSVNRLAARHHDSGRFGEAQALLAPTVPILERRVASDPSASNRTALSSNLGLLGVVQEAQRRYAEADANLSRASELMRELDREQPGTLLYRSSMVVTLMNHGIVLNSMGRTDEAIRLQREVVELGEALVRDFPGVPKHRELLILIYTNLAAASWGSPDDSADALYRALELVDGMIAESPDTLAYQATGTLIAHDLARWLLEQELFSEAEAELLAVLESAHALEAEMGSDYRLLPVLRFGPMNLALARAGLGDESGAMAAIREIDALPSEDALGRVLEVIEECIQLAAREPGDDVDDIRRRTEGYAEQAALLLERSLAAGLTTRADFWRSNSFEVLGRYARFADAVARLADR